MNKSIDDRRLIFIYGTCFEDDRRSLCDLHVLHGMATYMEDDRRSSSHLHILHDTNDENLWIDTVATIGTPCHEAPPGDSRDE